MSRKNWNRRAWSQTVMDDDTERGPKIALALLRAANLNETSFSIPRHDMTDYALLVALTPTLARALGHAVDCKLIACPHQCTCGVASLQADALAQYARWKASAVNTRT